MKKRFATMLAVLTAGLLVLSGCGGKNGGTASASPKQAIEKLLSADYELEYAFGSAGLPVDGTAPKSPEGGGVYFPVQSETYKKLADLKTLLEATYTSETASRILATQDAVGGPLYLDIDAKLYRSSAPTILPLSPLVLAEDIVLGEAGKAADGQKKQLFTVTERSDDGGESVASLEAVQVKSGQWRLREQRALCARTQTKAGAGVIVAGELGATAQSFLDALQTGDAAAIKALATDEGSYESTYILPENYSYEFLTAAGVTSATITDTVLDTQSQAEYQVTLAVSGGNGTFAAGTTRWLLGVSLRESGPVITQFYPQNQVPYLQLPLTQQINNAANQVYRLMRLQGGISFAAPKELSASLITEYALMELSNANPDTYTGFSLEQVQKEVVKLFAMENFTPDQNWYNTETKSFVMYGRGGEFLNARISVLSEGDGVAKIEATHYSDPLQLMPAATVVYTLKNNWNGTYEFVSAVMSPV